MIPKVKFRLITFEENIDLLSGFIYDELHEKNNDRKNLKFLKNKYIELKNIDFTGMGIDEIKNILTTNIKSKWEKEILNNLDKVTLFQNNFDEINDSVMNDLSKKLNIEWPRDCSIIECRIGVMYSCPRYIDKRMFDIKLDVNTNTMREITVHELCHFLYFEKWKELFNDYDESHYNRPNIIWYLSEAIIDPLLNNDMFKKYTNKEICSYKMFYELFINNESVIDKLRKIISSSKIEDAIKESYKYFLENQNIIKGD